MGGQSGEQGCTCPVDEGTQPLLDTVRFSVMLLYLLVFFLFFAQPYRERWPGESTTTIFDVDVTFLFFLLSSI